MTSINVALYGESIAKELGKKSTVSDIALYSHSSSDATFSFVEPVTYPDKISSLFFPAMMANIAVVNLSPDWLDYRLGEIIMTLNALEMRKGIVALNGYLDADQVYQYIKGTVLENYLIMQKDVVEIKQNLKALHVVPEEGPTKILVDHSFDVKSVGSVVLGLMQRGSIKPYDKLWLQPGNKEVMIKSIQMQDKTVQSASFNDRVGLAIKGASVEELSRGSVLVEKDSLEAKKEFKASFRVFSYFNESIPETMHIAIGLQWAEADVTLSGDGMEAILKPRRPLVVEQAQPLVYARPGKPGTKRLIGAGKIL